MFVRYVQGPNCTVAHFLPYKLQYKKLPKDVKMISKMIHVSGETVKTLPTRFHVFTVHF